MVNLYTLPTSVIVLFIVVILSLFLANSVLYYFLMPQARSVSSAANAWKGAAWSCSWPWRRFCMKSTRTA